MKKKNWEGCTCIVYHTCKKKREIIDKKEKRPSKHGHGGLHQLQAGVDDKVSCQATGAAEVVLGQVQKCMAARKVGFVGR